MQEPGWQRHSRPGNPSGTLCMPRMPAMLHPRLPEHPQFPKLFSVPKTLPDAPAVQPVLFQDLLWMFTNHPQLPAWLLQLPVPSSWCASCSSRVVSFTSQNVFHSKAPPVPTAAPGSERGSPLIPAHLKIPLGSIPHPHPPLTPRTPAQIPCDRFCPGSAWTWTGGARRRGTPSGSRG